MSIDAFLNRSYDAANYNCAHFVCDVWEAETGCSIRGPLGALLRGKTARRVDRDALTGFAPLAAPYSPSIVLMRRPRAGAHVGIFIRGRVAHIRPSGVAYQPLRIATFGFTLVSFYGYANSNYSA